MCEPAPSRGPSLRAVAAALAGVAACAAILKLAESLAEAFTLTVFAACAVGVVALVRAVLYGHPWRRPVKREAVNHTVIRAALAAPRLAIEQRRVMAGEVAAEPERMRA